MILIPAAFGGESYWILGLISSPDEYYPRSRGGATVFLPLLDLISIRLIHFSLRGAPINIELTTACGISICLPWWGARITLPHGRKKALQLIQCLWWERLGIIPVIEVSHGFGIHASAG